MQEWMSPGNYCESDMQILFFNGGSIKLMSTDSEIPIIFSFGYLKVFFIIKGVLGYSL